MTFYDIPGIRAQAASQVQEHRASTRKLVLIYCGVLALVSLGGNILTVLLDSGMGSTGGLDGIGMRSVLQSVQRMLYYITAFFGPFWGAGFVYAMLQLVRGRSPRPVDLTEGFRRFGRILMATVYQALVLIGLALLLPTVASMTIFAAVEDPLVLTALILGLFLGVAVCVLYSFRMATYLMMERKIGGVAALQLSRLMMRGRKRQFLKLDLSYWWYYVLSMLVTVVAYLDVFMQQLEIPLPMGETEMFFVTLVIYLILNTLLSLWKKCEVDAATLMLCEQIAADLTPPAM